jgi:Uma2 family endonuclease
MMDRVAPSINSAFWRADSVAVVTPSTQPAEPTDAPDNGAIPPLENGDRLTRAEFERRYEVMPELKKAELIEGEVYMPSPVRYKGHSHPHTRLVAWLANYETDTPWVEAGDNGTIRLDLDNEPQPDAFLIIRPERGGQARISEDDYIEGAPELVAEVASSSASYDLGKKLNAYRRNGVREYVVWRVLDQEVDWFVNREGRFEPLPPGDDGILRSTLFPGLWLDPAALARGDKARVKAILQQGLDSLGHADFVKRLEGDHTA